MGFDHVQRFFGTGICVSIELRLCHSLVPHIIGQHFWAAVVGVFTNNYYEFFSADTAFCQVIQPTSGL
jgi:hypothetical protein